MDDGAWAWTCAEPARYCSSPGVERRFRPACGAQVAYRSERWPGEMHFFAALLDDHASFAPQGDVNWAEKVARIDCADGLPHT